MYRYFALLLLLVICRIGCSQSLDLADLDSLQLKTLASLEKINDDLYTMDYKANYFFSEYKAKGIGNLSIIEFIEKYLDSIPNNKLWLCSAFMAVNDKDIIVGRNFDWETIPGLVLFTDPPNCYKSISLVPIDLMLNRNAKTVFDNAKLLWAPYFPVDGMNDKGLVVIELAVDGDVVHENNKITMASLHLIRLLLDYASNLDEAIELLNNYNNEASYRCHFFIADASGSSAIVEYFDNKIVATKNRNTWQVVTNKMVYKKSERELRKICDRYYTLSKYLSTNNGSISIGEAFNLLKSVSIENSYSSQFDIFSSTQWSVLYNLDKRSINIVSQRNYEKIYHFEFDN